MLHQKLIIPVIIIFFSLISVSCLKSESSVCKSDTDCENDEKCCMDAVSGASTTSKEGTCQTSCNYDVNEDDADNLNK